jgi:hypothetical protein
MGEMLDAGSAHPTAHIANTKTQRPPAHPFSPQIPSMKGDVKGALSPTSVSLALTSESPTTLSRVITQETITCRF